MNSKIAVLMGGRSLERSVSLVSGRRVARALEERGYDVVTHDVDESLVSALEREKPDLVYIALHGKEGEDGTIQELLEIMDIPYTGPGSLSSILGFNKVLTKELFRSAGIQTPRYYTLSTATVEDMGAAALLSGVWNKLGSPVVVKPAAQGSALGVRVVERRDDLPDALAAALGYDERALIEEYISGREVSLSVLGSEDPLALPAVEVVPESGFFDYEARYTPGKTDYFVPARLSDEDSRAVARIALEAHRLLRCKDLSRTDMIVPEGGEPFVLEINISPGMTETSLLPLAAESAGLSFADLVEKIVLMSL